ncbi:MAG: hypothetical protein LBQ24_07305 [Candidatus Peribacteria bacterium]|nr:hypothetical protein [Candidatus Peribacteria bacterium]
MVKSFTCVKILFIQLSIFSKISFSLFLRNKVIVFVPVAIKVFEPSSVIATNSKYFNNISLALV